MTAQIQASKIGGLVRAALTIVSNPDPPPVLVPEAKTRIFGLVFFITESPFCLKRISASFIFAGQSSDSIRNYAAGLAAAVKKGLLNPLNEPNPDKFPFSWPNCQTA